jgi:hypothetical protein
VLRRIGGDEAELALAESLSTSVFGLEIAYLTRMLHELAPNKHRENALTVARTLLASGTSPVFGAVDNRDSRTPPQNPMVRNHREYLFAVLSFYGDSSFASDAQRKLVGADTQIDRGALRYLQRALGAEAIPVVAQVYNNPQLGTNAAAKEPLARLALNFVGQDARANAFYQQAINDPALTRSHRRNLIEDLNEDGFADPRNLTGNDLPLIQNRIALIEQLSPSAMDQVNAEAFQEAYKDLINMRRRASQPPGQPASFRGQNSINLPGQ